MGFFGSTKSVNTNSSDISSATEEEEDTAAAKSRLLATEGENKGAELAADKGKSVRRIFGA